MGSASCLRPLLDEKVIEEANPKDYRGSIRPTNVDGRGSQNYLAPC